MGKKKSPNLIEGRTKEWNESEWQGRSKKQVESINYSLYYILLTAIVGLLIYGLIKFIGLRMLAFLYTHQ
jgi:hypothetical protein